MFFTAFPQNGYPIVPTYQNYEFCQNFQNQMTGFVTTVPHQFNDLYQWNQFLMA
jgi:hypothetical protein